MTGLGLGRGSITNLLQELADELGRRGAKADLFLVGGAALALVYDAARSTRDLDAVFLPTGVGSGSLDTRPHGNPAIRVASLFESDTRCSPFHGASLR